MKTSGLICVLSLFAIGLLGAVIYVAKRAPVSGAAKTEAVSGGVAIEANVETKVIEERASQTITPVAKEAFNWRNVESPDYREYVANLRAIGCPEQTLRDIVIADVNKLYAPREEPLKMALTNSIPRNYELRVQETERRKALRAVQLEKRALIKELVGVEIPIDILRTGTSRDYAEFEAAFNALPPGKREQAREIQETYWQNSDALNFKYRGTNVTASNWRTPDYLKEYAKLNEARRDDLMGVLTPTEFQDYEMRVTSTGQQMRYEFASLNVSEDEFRQLFNSRREVEAPFGGGQLSASMVETDESGSASSSAERRKRLDELTRELLGEERFAQLQKQRDYNYQTLNRLGERYGIERDALDKAYEFTRDYQQNMQRIQEQPGMTSQQRQEMFRAFASEREEKLKLALGERAAKAYNRNNRGYYAGDFE